MKRLNWLAARYVHPAVTHLSVSRLVQMCPKLSAGRLLVLHTQNLPQGLLRGLQGVLEHGSLDMRPWPPREAKVTAADAFCSVPSPGDVWVPLGLLLTSCTPFLTCVSRGHLHHPVSLCITPKLMGARTEASIAFAPLGTDRVKIAATSVQTEPRFGVTLPQTFQLLRGIIRL